MNEGRYIPTLGGALRDADEEAAHSLAEASRQAAEASARDEAKRYAESHLCNTCFHAPVCAVHHAVQMMAVASGVDLERSAGLVWIGRCGQYVELPSVPEPEPAE